MLYVQLWWLMKIDKLNKTHVYSIIPRNLFFFHGDHDEAFFSFLLFPHTVLNFLLDLLTLLTVIKNFRLHLPNTKQIRYQNLQLLKVLRTFQKKVRILFRESLQNLFLATFPCVVKINSTKSASNESIAKS